MTPEFDASQRELLQHGAGDLFQKIVLKGSIPAADQRIAADGPHHDGFALLLQIGLIALDPATDSYVPVDPAIVQSQVVTPMGQRAADLLAESSSWAATFAELGQAYRRTSPGEPPITEIRGSTTVKRFLAAALGDAETELLTAHPEGARPAKISSAALKRDREALARGVAVRTLFQHPARRSAATREYVNEIATLGAEVRTLDEFFNRLVVVDRRLAIIPGTDPTDVAIAIHDPNLIRYLVDIFERAWERGRPFHDREAEPEITDDVHNMAIRMLVEGYSDNASAKRVGVSTRTYAGYVAALKAAYNVETRFQLGYAIGQQELNDKGREKPPPQI